MIDKKFVYDKVIPLIEKKGRKIDVLLIQNLFEDKQQELVDELREYQNEDFGLGHALEADIRMPYSSVASTDHGVSILDQVKDTRIKEELEKELVEYYESVYNEELERFVMVDERVEEFPHAVWWTHKDILTNFTFGNPDPEVIGFLYQNRKHLKKLNIIKLINKVVDYIMSDDFKEGGMHHLLSVAMFYTRVDKDVQNLIRDRLIEVVDSVVESNPEKWNEYVLEPYKVYVVAPDLCANQMVNVDKNLEVLLDKVSNLSVEVPWQWYRDEEVFEKVKNDWLGYIYFGMIKALRLHREL